MSLKNFREMMDRESRQRRRKIQNSRNAVIGFLHNSGVKIVTVSYDGYGDDGNIGEPMYDKKIDGSVEVPNTEHEVAEWSQEGELKRVVRCSTLNELITDLCYEMLHDSRPGWEINEGSFGGFTIDVQKNSIEGVHNQRFESYETSREDY